MSDFIDRLYGWTPEVARQFVHEYIKNGDIVDISSKTD